MSKKLGVQKTQGDKPKIGHRGACTICGTVQAVRFDHMSKTWIIADHTFLGSNERCEGSHKAAQTLVPRGA